LIILVIIAVAALILLNKEDRNTMMISSKDVDIDSQKAIYSACKAKMQRADKEDSLSIASSRIEKPKIAQSKPVQQKPAAKAPDTAKPLETFSQSKLFNYLSIEKNRQTVLQKALALNNGQYVNACVFFVSEALRKNSVNIPNTTCNTTQLVSQLKGRGWTRSTDYKDLHPGDICFTTDKNGGDGAPTHTYIFMCWVSPNSYDYAMICDNQADRYGAVYHKRNITKKDVYKGEQKEAFQFFMRK
jgi:hypothetical protein